MNIFSKSNIKLFTLLFITWCIFFYTPAIRFFLNINNHLSDLMYQVKYNLNKPNKPPENIVIIDIDDDSLWLIERPDYLADLIKIIAKKGEAEVIGIDILFDDYKNPLPPKSWIKTNNINTETEPYEKKLAEILNDDDVSNVVLIADVEENENNRIILYPLPILKDSAWGIGFNMVPLDNDEICRKAILYIKDENINKLLYSFPFAIAIYVKNAPKIINNKTIKFNNNIIKCLNSFKTGFAIIPQLLGPKNQFTKYKVKDLRKHFHDKKYLKKIFKNKIVLIGSESKLLKDLIFTPYSNFKTNNIDDYLMPGVEFHANILNSLLNNKFYLHSSNLFNLLWAVFWIFLSLISILYSKSKYSFLFPIIFSIISFITAYFLFINSSIIVICAGTTILIMLISIPVTYGYKFITVDKLFGRYVSPDVAELIWNHKDDLVLTGERKIATVIFSDIRGFTSISENTDPAILLKLLNDYFEKMSEIIYKNNGNLNKFIGDGLMILYGTPISDTSPQKDAYNGVKSGIEMLNAVNELNLKWKREHCYANINISIGIGIHTGEVIVGNIGSLQRLEYSAIGDTVNLASRLESTNKEFNTNIILSEDTFNLVKNDFELKYLNEVKVKGRVQPVKIYTLDKQMEELK